MLGFEQLLMAEPPDWVIVVGDVNSTMACALAAVKLNIRVAHVEAGLRSGNRTMPEEINRLVTDAVCDLLFTTERQANENLRAEGIPEHKIRFVGNVMIDTLLRHRDRAAQLREWEKLHLRPREYAVLTLHRPSNVDDPVAFTNILDALEEITRELKLVFPVHPRTRKTAESLKLWDRLAALPNILLLEPLGYLEMLSLTSHARLILTDSGGLQEEAVVLGIPCITLREDTERPVTLEIGANELVGSSREAIVEAFQRRLSSKNLEIPRPEKWDGRAARRIVAALLERR
jgi:UDP-N-acetylglucosamine 2-epimerase (non-hydrolysing)